MSHINANDLVAENLAASESTLAPEDADRREIDRTEHWSELERVERLATGRYGARRAQKQRYEEA